MLSDIIEQLKTAGICFEQDVPMSKRTWIHRGPVVPLYIKPDTIEELETCTDILLAKKAAFKVVGHTSNIYMLPTYHVDAVVSTTCLNRYEIRDTEVTAETGVNISNLSDECVGKGILGFEGLVGLPGTVGAAVINNASCYKCAPSSMLKAATILEITDGKAVRRTVDRDYFEYSHRSSALKRGEKKAIVLDVTFKVERTTDIKGLRKVAEWNRWHRNTYQEGKAKNLGSVFSMFYPKRFGLKGICPIKYPMWFAIKIADRLFLHNKGYQFKRSDLYLRLYGYYELSHYVSKKNGNCFIWKDEGADKAFERYKEFMQKCYTCGTMEIEILGN